MLLSTPFIGKRYLHDLSRYELFLMVTPLLTANVPVGIAFIYLAMLVAFHQHRGEDVLAGIVERVKRRVDEPTQQGSGPDTTQKINRFKELSQKDEAWVLGEDELYELSDQLLLTEPKPWLRLHQHRLDLSVWMLMMVYNFYRLHQLFPEAIEKLFLKK